MGFIVPLCAVSQTAAQETATLSRFTFSQYHMGVDTRLVVYAKSQTVAEEACVAAFARIAELDSIMSDYRKDSELIRLCANAGKAPTKVSKDLFKVIERSLQVSRWSGGAFDISVGPLVSLWRKARKAGELPGNEEIQSALRVTGWRRILLDKQNATIKLTGVGMKLDLGGIAKGYACDQAQVVLKNHGIQRALVEMGGDIVVSGPPPGSQGWTIRVPNAGKGQTAKDMTFANCAVSTSGDTEQFTVIGGVRYSHVVDPRTGLALTTRTGETGVAGRGHWSDPLSTTLTLLDERARKRLMKRFPGSKSYVKVLKPGALMLNILGSD